MDTIEKIMYEYGMSRFPIETSYAMAYVPFSQNSPKLYAPSQGFEVGTMFEALDKPFYGKKCEGYK